MARPWVFESGVESARSALLRFNRALLDWSPVVQHISRLLHRSVQTALTRAADPVRHTPACRNSAMFRFISPGGFGVAMDARGATYWTRRRRLCLAHLSSPTAAFRSPSPLPSPPRAPLPPP